MYTAFSTALSALNATSTAVDVVGNNLANVNTTGFKASSVSFSDLVSQSMASSTTQVGMGTGRPSAVRQFTQGTIQASAGTLDAAIQGQGFFMVRDQAGQNLLTRAGSFHVDAAGNLLTATGERVQGWTAVNGAVNTNGAVGDITVPSNAELAPVATTKMSVDLNLNAGAAVGEADGTFSTPIEVVDSLGSSHVVTITFTKTGANEWSYQASIPGDEVSGGTAGQAFDLPDASGTLTFDEKGNLTDPAPDAAPVSIKIPGLMNGAADLSIDWSLYAPDGSPRLTQFAEQSATATRDQNGSKAAQLNGVVLSDGGVLTAHFSNGQDRVVGQLALASVRNPDSLISVGNNNFQAGPGSAAAVVGAPGTGGRGLIRGQALESCTVDIAREFTNLIVYQRSYQANARVVTTSDELSQETVNLKR